MTSFLRSDRSRAVAVWLLAVAALVLAMVVVGGSTRLTGSGLSITQWKPVRGVIPPLSAADWQAEFDRYKTIPQYRLINSGMTLAQFKGIYWWEWAHRLLGRLVGAAFLMPFLWFAARREIPQRLLVRLGGLFILGGLQGLVGWWMVESGLEARVSVAPERLAIHLGLALLLFCALVWTGLEAWSGQARPRGEQRDGWRPVSILFAAAVFLQCLLGALVAGNQAGLIDNDWPLMNGWFFPPDYAGGSFWATLAHSRPAVQFNHRMIAYAVVVAGVGVAGAGLNSRVLMGQSRALALGVGVVAIAQACLGVATLVLAVPLPLAMLHQAGAVLLLALATALAWRVRRV